eukprot:scaffold174121_cov38-Attheya_sp.AAC.3
MSGGGGTYPPSSFHNNKGFQRPTIQPHPLHSHSQKQQNDVITLLGGEIGSENGSIRNSRHNDEQYYEMG